MYKIRHLLKGIISNFLLEYVVFLMKYGIFCYCHCYGLLPICSRLCPRQAKPSLKLQILLGKIAKNTRNTNSGPISIFGFLQYFYQNRVNGLDLDRFCAPEHIIQMSNSSICWPFGGNSFLIRTTIFTQ